MKSFVLAAVLATALAQAPDLGNLPVCAQSCLNLNDISSATGCTQFDFGCICGSAAFIAGLSCCVSQHCSPSDQQKTIQYAQGICEAAGVTVPTKAACSSGAAPTGAASSGAASTAAPASGSSTSAAAAAGTGASTAPASGSSASVMTMAGGSTMAGMTSAGATTGTAGAGATTAASAASVSSAGAAATLLGQGIGAAGALFAGVAALL